MNKKIKIALWVLLFIPIDGFSKVRTIYTNDQKMNSITLQLGKSTVLRFSSSPIKAVMGNPDQVDVEFIGNDLALRPKGMVETNLFVYTKGKRVFGFLIRVAKGKSYDDLVHVRWRFNRRISVDNK
ncbi:MAG: pilus assembly protein N-terminal domain-containing protein [Halobacteriovoraceae bacterium]|nr:pilus assembly protein N-terminal domain-containing protein [Halobacteriovoraceae bacterium]